LFFAIEFVKLEGNIVKMNPGPQLVIKGTFLGSLFVCVLLFLITAGVTFPPPKVAKAIEGQAEVVGISVSTDSEIQTVPLQKSSDVDTCLVSKKFPKKVLQWCELITLYARKQNLSPDLVAAMIWQESGGNPVAYSKSGAVGLMQVMPSDGLAANFQCVSGPCFANRPTTKELKDPEYNIKYGTRMLANLIKKHGDPREALKAYGPMNVGYYYADKVMHIYKQYGQE
jgi:hypothetical protein